ncbi:hypothetical protein H5410_031569 [Solanum commersonii]|uniref:Uncharacterized protein n=1 Tax=Solanum commersonii TaxID=4109 RepID=A0A9J5YKB4_SOLCO|nr:hypothetical protein H5410_031569 [Solanum commersonii]
MEYNQNDILHLAVSYLEDSGVCLSVTNIADAMNQSIGRVIHYIIPMLSKSDKMQFNIWRTEAMSGNIPPCTFNNLSLYLCKDDEFGIHMRSKSYQWWSVEDVVFPCRKEWIKLPAWYLSCPKMTSLAEFRRLCLTTSHGHD